MNINQQWQRKDALLPQVLVSYMDHPTTRYCTRALTFLASVSLFRMSFSICLNFLNLAHSARYFLSVPAHSQQLTWSLIVLNCKLNIHCFSLNFTVFKKEGGGVPISGSALVYNLKQSF